MNYLTNENYEAFQRGLHSLPDGLYLDAPDDNGDRMVRFVKDRCWSVYAPRKDGTLYDGGHPLPSDTSDWTRLCGLGEGHQPQRWLPTEDGYAVRVTKIGIRIIYHVRDGKVDNCLKPDGTLRFLFDPDYLGGTWEPFAALPEGGGEWGLSEVGYAVLVRPDGTRSVYHVHDGKVSPWLNPDGTLCAPRDPAKLDGTWEPLPSLPAIP